MSFVKLMTNIYGPPPALVYQSEAVLVAPSKRRSEADEYDATIQSLRTIEDVIVYFAKFGDSTLIKMVYCVLDDQSTTYNPYRLVVVRDVTDNLSKQRVTRFSTVSKFGLMEYSGRGECLHITLPDWIQYSAWFGLITCIPFFRHFLIKKYTHRIRTRGGRNIFKRKQLCLKSRLLCMREPFRTDYAKYISLISSSLIPLNLISTHLLPTDIQQWKSLQLKHVTDSIFQVQKIESDLVSIVKNITQSVDRPPSFSIRQSALERRLNGRLNQSTSVSDLKKAKLARQVKERKTKADIELLVNFTKLTNMILTNAMIDLRVGSLIQLSEFIINRQGSILITIELNPKLSLTQTSEDICGCISTMMNDIQERFIKSALVQHEGLYMKDPDNTWFPSLVKNTCNKVTVKFQQIDLACLSSLTEAQKYLDDLPRDTKDIQFLRNTCRIKDELALLPVQFESSIFNIDASSQVSMLLQRFDIAIAEARSDILGTIKNNVQTTIGLLHNVTREPNSARERMRVKSEVLTRISQIDEDYKQLTAMNVKIPNDDTFNYNFLSSKCKDQFGEELRK